MESTKTFTTRSNAKRNALKAGVPAESVEITAHGKGDDVRFGWRQLDTQVLADTFPTPAKAKTKTTAKRKSKAKVFADANGNGKNARVLVQPQEPEVRGGVKRPREGTICRSVWDWLDKNPGMTIKEAKEAAPGFGFNVNNVVAEYYARRKWMAAA